MSTNTKRANPPHDRVAPHTRGFTAKGIYINAMSTNTKRANPPHDRVAPRTRGFTLNCRRAITG